jgi:hypothetical protein
MTYPPVDADSPPLPAAAISWRIPCGALRFIDPSNL